MRNALSILLIFLLFVSCSNSESVKGNGNTITVSRSTENFDGVSLMGSMNVQLIRGAENAVQITADENIISYIETTVEDGTLKIKYSDGIHINTGGEVTVKVTLPTLQEAEITGSGDIKSETRLTGTEEIELKVTGSGTLSLELDAPAVEATITGSGNMQLSGQTRDIQCSSKGSGKIDAMELKSENATVKTYGSGDVNVYASVKLDATINGSGTIRYKGGASANSKIHGSGTVKAVD